MRTADWGGGGGGGGGGIRTRKRRTQTKLGEDNVENLTLRTDPNAPLTYAPGLEHHHQIISTLGDTGGQLKIEREIEIQIMRYIFIYIYM